MVDPNPNLNLPMMSSDVEKLAGTKTISTRTRGHYVVTPMMLPPPHLHQTTSMFQTNLEDPDRSIQQHTSLREQQQSQQPTLSPGTGADFLQFIAQHNDDDDGAGGGVELKWSRHDFCSPCNCICCFLAILFLIIALMSGIYYGLNFFDGKHLKERVFKAQFVMRNPDFMVNNLLDNLESNEFHAFSESLKTKINTLFQQSVISDSFLRTEMVAYERKRNSPSEVIVHINIHLAANRPNVEASDIYLVLADEIINNRLKVFENLMVDHNSIDVQERRWLPREKATINSNPWTYKSMFPGMLEGLRMEPTPPPRRCGRIDLSYCQFLSYNQTSYPNFFNHWNLSSIEDEFILYKELIDSECYSLSKEFICNLLQPECRMDNMMILPCQEFCKEFYDSCKKWLPDKLMKKIACHFFPNADHDGGENQHQSRTWLQNWNNNDNSKQWSGRGREQQQQKCRSKPNCATVLRLQSQQHKLCDGIIDCKDLSDEISCQYCDTGHQQRNKLFHCGDKQCVSLNLTCDNIKDCQNGADEINCLRLASFADLESATTILNNGKQGHDNNNNNNNSNNIKLMSTMVIANEGYLEAISKGKRSFVCSSVDHTTPSSIQEKHSVLAGMNRMNNHNNYTNTYYDSHTPMVGHNICNGNHFEKLVQIEHRTVSITNVPFTRFVPGTTLPSPYPIQCRNKQVYYVECANPQCGINHIPMVLLNGNEQSKNSWPGYWPWYAKININGHYYCDGTLITMQTILAQTICFNQPRSLMQNHNLSVVLGSVRLSQDNSEAQEYPVTKIRTQNIHDHDQKLTLLELDSPIKVSNIIRPVCHNGQDITWTGQHKCVLVNLNYELDVLQHRPVKIVNMEQCKKHLAQLEQQWQLPVNDRSTSSPLFSSQSSTSTKSAAWQHLNNVTHHYHQSSNHNYKNKLCVESYNHNDVNYNSDDTFTIINNGSNTNNLNETCQNCSQYGRHLYCLAKNQWNLLAIEFRTLSSLLPSKSKSPYENGYNHDDATDPDSRKQLILFQIIPKL